MKRTILWIFLASAPLVSAGSLGFQASCSGITCSGNYNGNAWTFVGPFPDGRAGTEFGYNPFVDIGIGTNGGVFMSGGNTCDYGVILGPGNFCDAEASFGANIGPPDETGHSLGDVVTVKGLGMAQGSFCWDGDCPSGAPAPPFFQVNVMATYEFTLTDPGTSAPFTWTGAQFSSVPEPRTLAFAALGLVGLVTGWRRRFRN